MDNRHLDWLYLMGLHDTLDIINNPRLVLYTNCEQMLNVKKLIIYGFIKNRQKRK